MINLGKKLEELLYKNGFNTNSFSKISGIPQPTLHKILEGKTTNPGIKTIELIATNLGVSPQEFFDDAPYQPVVKGLERVPLFPWIIQKNASDVMEMCRADRSEGFFYPEAINSEQRIFCLQIEGDYYIPTFRDGDIVFFDNLKYPTSGSFVVIVEEGEVTTYHGDGTKTKDKCGYVQIKQVITDGIRAYLRSLNTDIPDNQLEPIKDNQGIIGTCIGHFEKFTR